MSTMRWSEPSLPEDGSIGTTPTIKNHSVTFYRGLLYCFGGYDGRRNNQTLLIYSLREGKWIAPTDPLVSRQTHEQFGAQYNVPPGRNGHTATLATSRRSRASMRARRNDNLNIAENMQQQHPGDAHDENVAAEMNENDPQAVDYDGGGENMQGGDVMPMMPLNEENSMDSDDDDDEDAQIFIIGGWLGSGPLAASDMWVLDISGGIDRLRWFQPPVRGTPPGPCNMHSADYIASRGEVYVFRGGNGREYLNDLHALNTTTYVWRTVETTGEAPQQRANHSSSVLEWNGKTELFVFGGWNGSERLNDLHVLDTVTSTWSTPRISGSRPHPRAGMSLTALRGRLYLFGGSGTSSKCFDDLQVFDRKEMAWLDVNDEDQQSNQSSPSRYGNAERHMFPSWGLSGQDGMMGTDRSNEDEMNSPSSFMFTDWRSQEGMYATSQQPHSANPNDEDMVASVLVTGKPPGKRAGHTATAVGRHIYVFGGSCGTDYLSDLFVLDTDPPPLMKLTESTCPELVSRRLKHFFNDEEFSDVTFLVEGREVHGHKLILSTVSDCFRAMFMTGFKESGSGCTQIEIPNCTYSSFLTMMEYIYTGRVPELDVSSTEVGSGMDFVISLLELADQFFLYSLKQICEKAIQKQVNAETYTFLLQIAQKTNASQLESYCRYFERNHQNEMNL
mmetsp:Transcript_17787/g.30052  ORF Transcript_17787/g.30052 Transcript_17787/m.30052 type:complete len:674 (-) Transcript_17787:356-2377(-)